MCRSLFREALHVSSECATLFHMASTGETLETVFREEYGRIISTLIRLSGSFDLAEDALQEAFATAAANWISDGAPQNPAAWLTTVARRKLLDVIRREKTRTDKQRQLLYEAAGREAYTGVEIEENVMEYPDDRLALIFTCCHPSLNIEAQVALTLRTLGGLTTSEIARTFLLPEQTLAQRIVRAKNKIRLAGIPYQVPTLDLLTERLYAVQTVIYLIFNEGYSATAGVSLTRVDLCTEAIRLGRMLCELIPNEPESLGLLSLMLLQNSRRDTRTNEEGELVTLEEQDRSKWNKNDIDQGLEIIERALTLGRGGGSTYQIQASIAALHAEAVTADQTDWPQIAALYQKLLQTNSSPVVALNHAVAVAMSEGSAAGLALIEQIAADGKLEGYHLLHASRADLLRRLGRFQEALPAYSRALALTTNSVEQNYVKRRMSEITRTNGNGH